MMEHFTCIVSGFSIFVLIEQELFYTGTKITINV